MNANSKEIRVIAPSQSMIRAEQKRYVKAAARLEAAGYVVTFGQFVWDNDFLGCASAKKRTQDLENAFRDENVCAVLAATGGWFENELLPLIDWRIIANNPKPFIGFSDNTILVNAIPARTGVVAWLGPNFATLGRRDSGNFTLSNLLAALQQPPPRQLARSQRWLDGKECVLAKSWQLISPGVGVGILYGGNISTLFLLQGTPSMPTFNRPFILAIEDDSEAGKYALREFRRKLQSLMQQPGARANLKGVLVGRFESAYLGRQIDRKRILCATIPPTVPIVAEVDFGHTLPMAGLPIGGKISIDASSNKAINLEMVEY